MKILLIKTRDLTPDHHGIVPPLGIMYVGSALRSWGGHEVALLDTGLNEDVDRAVARFKPEIVGLSTITPEAPVMHAIARLVKSITKIPVVAGGAHPSSYPEETLRDSNVDYIVLGEGERTMLELVDILAAGKDPKDIPGVAVRRNDTVHQGPPREPIRDLDSLPFPAWDLIPIDAYIRRTIGKYRLMALFTSRGCPYRCAYCHENFGKSFRGRSATNVLAEMDILIHRYGVRDFEFVDDIFNWDLPRSKQILDGVIRLGPDLAIHFPNGLRSDRLDEEFLVKAKQAGLKLLSIAIETSSERLQRLIQKNLKLDRVRWAIETASRLRIYTNGFFILGFPTETRQEMLATVDFAVRSRLHQALFFTITPFEGTTLVRQWGHLLREKPTSFADYDYYRGTTNMSTVPNPEFYRIQRRAYRRFYSQPGRIWRIIRDHPNHFGLTSQLKLLIRKLFLRRTKKHVPMIGRSPIAS